MREILYDVVTLSDCMQDPGTMDWLAHLDLPLPDTMPSGRYPTSVEIKEALEAIPGVKVSYFISNKVWEAVIRSRKDVSWANLIIKNYDGNPHSAHHFCFPAGWDEIIILATSHLVKRCGPLVLLPGSGDLPQLVY